MPAPSATSRGSTQRRSPARSRSSPASPTPTRRRTSPELRVDTEALTPEESAAAHPRQAGRARPGRGRGARRDRCRHSAVTVTVTETGLIAPHGGSLVDRTGERPDDLDALETLTLTPREVADLDMLASGALSPLEGFMGHEDYERVVEDMHLANGLAWALPVCLAVEAAPAGDRVALADGDGTTAGRPRGRGGLRVRQGARGRALLPHDRRGASRRRPPLRAAPALPRRQGHRLRAARSRRSRSWRSIPRTPARPSRSEAGAASSASRPATRSTARTST